jgi:hypothetical protein
MTPSEWIFAAFVVLTVIHLFVPSARSGIASIYDAGMFAIYLIVLAWGVTRIVEGERTRGWEDVFLVQPGVNSRPGEQRPRYAGFAGVLGPQEHPAHGSLHRVVAGSVQ